MEWTNRSVIQPKVSQRPMNARLHEHQDEPEEFLADLTDAVYHVALRHGIKGSFLEMELELWSALRGAYARQEQRAIEAVPRTKHVRPEA
jgi:hypothetical protein